MGWVVSSWIPGFGLTMGLASFYVGLLYPTFQSFKAIESHGSADDTQWLTYWVTVCTLQLVEKVAWPVLCWLPLYALIRFLVLAWLAHPATKGATFLYEEFIRPLLMSLADTCKDIPVLEPLVRDFTPASARVHAKSAPASSQGPDLDALQREAVKKVEQTFEEAKKEEYDQPLSQTYKAHPAS